MHPRQHIRQAMRACLDAIPALAGRVTTNRSRPTQDTELPAVSIYTLSEDADYADMARNLRRLISAGVEVRIAATEDLDDALDALCLVIEQALAADRRLGGLVLDQHLTRTAIGLDGEGEARQAVATLTYTIDYISS